MAAPPAPTYINGTVLSSSGSNVRVITPHASTLEGDLLIVVAVSLSTVTTTAPGDWRTLKSFFATGTLGTAAWAKRREAGETSYSFPMSGSSNSQHLCMTIRGWSGDVSQLVVGATGTRAASGGTVNTTAPAVTTVGENNYVLTIGTERSTATETGITSVDNVFTQIVWAGHAAGGIESIWVGQRVFSLNGWNTGSTTITYPNTQASNAGAFQVAIPAGVAVPTVGFGWVNRMTPSGLYAGWSTANMEESVVRAVLSQTEDFSDELVYVDVWPYPSGWVCAGFQDLWSSDYYYLGLECDGVVLEGGRLRGRVANLGMQGFTFLSGSCQYTGSNHAVFDQMRNEDAAFFIHQGDVHYADTSVEATWRNEFTQSMSAPLFKALLATLPMTYCWDNHDYAGQGQEADDWDEFNNPQAFIRELCAFNYPGSNEIYQTWVYGRVCFIQTDQWSERSPDEMAEGPTKRCMTQEQEDWLYATLEASTEALIVWATAWPLYRSVPGGRWGSYTTQRDRIKAWLAARPAILAKLVGIGGDSHSVSADTGVNQDALGPFPTLNASPLNQSGGLPSGTWDIVNFDTVDTDGYYSRVTITDTGAAIGLQWEAVNQSGTVVGTWFKEFTPFVEEDEPLTCAVIKPDGTPLTGHLYVYDGTTTVPVTNAGVAP